MQSSLPAENENVSHSGRKGIIIPVDMCEDNSYLHGVCVSVSLSRAIVGGRGLMIPIDEDDARIGSGEPI